MNLISKHVLHVAALPKQSCKCHNYVLGGFFFFLFAKGREAFQLNWLPYMCFFFFFPSHFKLLLCGGKEEIGKKP